MSATPGPWEWTLTEGPDGPYQLQGNVEYAEMNPILMAYDCGCKADKKTGRCPVGPDPEDRALIAAAPELLEVCKDMRLIVEAFETLGMEHACFDRLHTIIAKAQNLPKLKDLVGLYKENDEDREGG